MEGFDVLVFWRLDFFSVSRLYEKNAASSRTAPTVVLFIYKVRPCVEKLKVARLHYIQQ